MNYTPHSRRVVHDYYRIDIPSDIDDPQERGRLAILEAEERARVWARPCQWEVIADNGAIVTVRRTRYAGGK